MKSILREIGPITFPEFTGERIYMEPFLKKEGLPKNLTRWQPTVDAMLDGVDTDLPIYLMVDQGVVKAGKTHRRPGPHIDGNWLADVQAWGGPTHGPRPAPQHSPWPTHGHSEYSPEALMLASNIAACRAFLGEVDGTPQDGGDCSHLNLSLMDVVNFKPCMAYSGNVTLIHESLPVAMDCQRTVVRLNVPGVEI